MEYDGIYFHCGILTAGVVIVAGEWALAYPLWGSKRELFERWRENCFYIPLRRLHEINLRDARGIEAADVAKRFHKRNW